MQNQESIFSLIKEKQDLARAISKDGIILDKKRLRSINEKIIRKARRDCFDELLKSLSREMPEFSLGYNLIENPSSSTLISGYPIRKAITYSRRLRNYINQNQESSREYHDSAVNMNKILSRYYRILRRENQILERKDNIPDTFASETQQFEDLTSAVQELTEQILRKMPKDLPRVKKDNFSGYPGTIQEQAIRIISRLGKIELPYHLKETGLKILERLVPEAGEYYFATEKDSWSLFRQTFLDKKPMNFGLINLNENTYGLDIISHKDTNAINAIKSFKKRKPQISSQELETILDNFTRLTNEDKINSLQVYTLDSDEYDQKRTDWYTDLLKRLGILTTIKSMHDDSSLLLTRHELDDDNDEFYFQKTRRSLVNKNLRKVLMLGKILSQPRTNLKESYESVVPLLEKYQEHMFDLNIGVLASDLTQVPVAEGYLFLPTYLEPGNFPSIGISRPRFYDTKKEVYLDTVIAVRTKNRLLASAVSASIKRTFKETREIRT